MSQIDHNQIDGAMAEVISRAQSEKRVRQLDMVARKRSEESKRIDNLRQQGNLATKRAIISGARNRSTAHKQDANQIPGIVLVDYSQNVISPDDESNSAHRRISDFKIPEKPPETSPAPAIVMPTANPSELTHTPEPPTIHAFEPTVSPEPRFNPEPEVPKGVKFNQPQPAPAVPESAFVPRFSFKNEATQSSSPSVGQLSDQYLVDSLSSPPPVKATREEPAVQIESILGAQPIDHSPSIDPQLASPYSAVPEVGVINADLEPGVAPDSEPVSRPKAEPISNANPPVPYIPSSKKSRRKVRKAKHLEGPKEPKGFAASEEPEVAQNPNSEFKESFSAISETPSFKKSGAVHKIYGQKLPEEYLLKSNSRKKSPAKGHSKPARKRGFFSYLLILMITIALVAWGIAGYLFFLY